MCSRTGSILFSGRIRASFTVPENAQAGAVLNGLTLKSAALYSSTQKGGQARIGILKARLLGLWTGEPIDTR